MPYRLLWTYVAPYRGRYAFGFLCLLLANLFSLAIPWTLKNAIEALSAATAGEARIGRYVLLILALAAAHGLVRLGSRFTILGAGQRIDYDIRNDLYARLQSLPPAFYRAHRTGDLMSRSSSDIAAVKQLVGFGGLSLVGTSFAFLGTLAAMLAIAPWLTLWAMAPYPLLILLAKRFNADVHVRTQAVQEQLGEMAAKVQENLTGSSIVRAYTMEPREIAEFGRLNAEYLARSLALGRVQAQFAPLMGLVAGIGTLVILWVGGRAVGEGRLTLGALVAFNGYIAHLAWPTIALGWTLAVVRRGMTSLERIGEILASPLAYAERAAGAPAPGPGRVEFRRLSFAYDDRAPALADASFTIEPGQTVAVVGPTGSGKSTLGALLARLYEPPPGTLFVDGVDVREMDRAALRRRLAYVPQEAFLFSRSIRDNVAFAADDGRAARVEEARRVAGLAAEVEAFPAGWDTVVGERGLTLSGGQRQRVALARALATDAPILILDDVFANVDAAKEAEISAGLKDMVRGRTTLLVTHRLRAAEAADRVVVLDGGRVVEQGPHAALVARGGVYARLWRRQQLEDEIARA
jgi:ATP-binding cassette subfamily B multidrug efflux pump